MTTTYLKQVLLRRGNTAVSSAYTGPVGEITIDTDLETIRVHDGVTPGGRLATSSYSGTTPPGAPRENMLWYDTAGGRLYVYYGGAWVDASPAGDQELNANVAQLSSDVANVEVHITSLDANIGAFETATNNRVQSLSANIGTFENQVSANIGTFENTVAANVGAFETSVTGTVNTINANINALNETIAGFEANVGPTSDAWVDDAPPDISNVGALWYDADGGRLYVYYSGTWVDASPPSTTGFANVLPSANVTYSLGSEEYQWKDLWVSNNTIYIGNTPISVQNGTLLVNGNAVSGGGNANTGDFVFSDNFLTVSAGNQVVIQGQTDGNARIDIPNDNWAENSKALTISNRGAQGVEISTGQNNDYTWLFGNVGNLTLPAGGILGDTFGDGGLTLRSSEGKYSELGTFDGNAYIWAADAGYDGPSSNSAVYIATGYNTQSQHRWIFNADGSTQFPDDAIKAPDGRFISLIDNAGKNGVTVSETEVTISVQDTTEYNWTFGQDGNLILPTGGNILNSDNSVYGGVGTPAGNTGEIQVNVDGAFGSYDTLTYVDNEGEMTLGADYVNTGGLFVSDIYSRDILSNVNITSVYGTNWKFGSDGTTTIPGKLWARASDSGSIAFTNDGANERGYLKVDAGYNMVVNAENNFYVKRNGTDRLAIESNYTTIRSGTAARVETNLVGISRTYTFGETGVLGLPYDSYLESTPARNLNLGAWGDISIIANAETNSTTSWTFGTDGKLTAPGKVQIDDITNSISTTTGALIVGGGAGIHSDVHIGGTLRITDTTPSDDYTTGALVVDGGIGVNGNINLSGNINILNGNINIQEFTGSTGNFYGDVVTGFNAFYAGKSGFTALPYTVAQFSTTSNTYSQINMENTSTGKLASVDFVGTGDIGTDSSWFFDIGIANSGYDPVLAAENNAPGTSVGPLDTYFYVQGNVDIPETGGNLTIGTSQVGKVVKFIAGGTNTANVIATISEDGLSINKGSLTFSDNSVMDTAYGNVQVLDLLNNGVNINNGPINFTASPPAYSGPGIQWSNGFQDGIYGNVQMLANVATAAPITALQANVAAANAAIITANTAMKSYVDSRPSGGSTAYSQVTPTSSGTLTLDSTSATGWVVVNATAPSYTIRLPNTTTISNGASYTIVNKNAYAVTVANATGTSIGSIASSMVSTYTSTNAAQNLVGAWSLTGTNGTTGSTGAGSMVFANSPTLSGINLSAQTLAYTIFEHYGVKSSAVASYTATPTAVETSGVFTWTNTGQTYYAGQTCTVTGTNTGTGSITGYTNGTVYSVISSSSGTVQLAALGTANAITTTAGTIAGLTFTFGATVVGSFTADGPILHVTGAISSNFHVYYSGSGLGTFPYAGSVTVVVNQGATAYIPSSLNFWGNQQNVVINWQNGVTPTGNPNKKDVFTFTFLAASSTPYTGYTVLGSMSTFG